MMLTLRILKRGELIHFDFFLSLSRVSALYHIFTISINEIRAPQIRANKQRWHLICFYEVSLTLMVVIYEITGTRERRENRKEEKMDCRFCEEFESYGRDDLGKEAGRCCFDDLIVDGVIGCKRFIRKGENHETEEND